MYQQLSLLDAKPMQIDGDDRLLRLPDVRRRVGLGRSTIYRRMSAGTFPAPRCLGGNRVAWLERDIIRWMENCPAR